MTGEGTLSTTGSAGVSGKVNLLGVPVGTGKVFVAATDAKGQFHFSTQRGKNLYCLHSAGQLVCTFGYGGRTFSGWKPFGPLVT